MYGAFVRARRALDSPKRRFSARADDGTTEHHFVGATQVEEQQCGEGGAVSANDEDLRLGSRGTNGDAAYQQSHGNIGHNSEFIGDIDEVCPATLRRQ